MGQCNHKLAMKTLVLGASLNEERFSNKAVKRLIAACLSKEKLAICGDYDADGMTSTALLINTIRTLKGNPIPSIPSRMEDGYGLNKKYHLYY